MEPISNDNFENKMMIYDPKKKKKKKEKKRKERRHFPLRVHKNENDF
jgi:hypothetical protein